MNIQQLVKTDLNLLVTLYAILEERSVSRAADKLYVTQSAVSRSLSKMRGILGDPLFTRSGHQLVPTPFLEEMSPLLIATLDSANSILQPPTFNPKAWQGSIKLGITESMDLVLMPKLLGYLQKHAPGISIEPNHYAMNALEQLANGNLDLAIIHDYSFYPDDFVREPLLTTAPVILASDEHPLKKITHSFAEVTKFPKVSLRVPDWEKTHFFHSLSQTRDSVLGWEAAHEADSLLSAISIVRATEHLIPLPDILALEIVETGPLRFFTLAGYENVTYEYVIATHKRTAQSQVHHWIKELLIELARTTSEERDRKLRRKIAATA